MTADATTVELLQSELQEIKNLLAVIHGDGGHYTAEHGIAKAAADAIRIIHQRELAEPYRLPLDEEKGFL